MVHPQAENHVEAGDRKNVERLREAIRLHLRISLHCSGSEAEAGNLQQRACLKCPVMDVGAGLRVGFSSGPESLRSWGRRIFGCLSAFRVRSGGFWCALMISAGSLFAWSGLAVNCIGLEFPRFWSSSVACLRLSCLLVACSSGACGRAGAACMGLKLSLLTYRIHRIGAKWKVASKTSTEYSSTAKQIS